MNPPVLASLRDVLIGRRNTDGGWGYLPGKSSRIEPTCWSLLALASAGAQPIDPNVLIRWPRASGWLVDVAQAPVNYAFNALAAMTLQSHPQGVAAAQQIARQLVDVRGLRFEQGKEIRQDNSLQAWPWIDATFSWVEPTSLCLLLFKKMRGALPAAAAERISVGERMLIDRACAAGGWNYGGSNVYGQELFPYVPTTALGLLALQDRQQDPTVARAVAWIRKEAGTEPSAQATALAVLSLKIYRSPVAELEGALRKILETSVNELGTVGLAAGLYSLSMTKASGHGEAVFRL